MKLLIITQKVDRNDAVLGFFHRWLLEFAKNFKKITVICLERGEYSLSPNVKVLSLGKEELEIGNWKLEIFRKLYCRVRFLIRFYKYIWQTRCDYDMVFVHMNQEYILLGGPIWKILGKRIVFWYNHTCGNFLTKFAMFMADIICHTSPFAYTAGTKKSRRMPAGIDTTLFKLDEKIERKPKSIMYIGRIAPLKKVEVLIKAAKILDEEGIDFVLNLYGAAAARDSRYFEALKASSVALQTKGKLFFRGAVPNEQTPAIFNAHLMSVNLTPKGNYDKTVLEGMACGILPLVSSPAFNDIIPPEFRFRENDSRDLAEIIKFVFALSETAVAKYGANCRRAVQNHALVLLANNLATLFNSQQMC
ncbi:MAG: hypothetical protein CEO19_422 [Parcubacteria group bacterium Gr01-1014_73]|nr:MAG: hypothetical protein CEO19_422 [Parcubacteria group bacterium Gr01-1014_73]